MMNCAQLTNLVIKPALEDLILYSLDAVELLLFTCAVESNGGSFLAQEAGPALGIYQMEPKTYNDIWVNYIAHESILKNTLIHAFNIPTMPVEDRMIYDLRFATVMARIHYGRVSAILPDHDDVNGLWNYYKTYYNSNKGKANSADAIAKYHKFKASTGLN